MHTFGILICQLHMKHEINWKSDGFYSEKVKKKFKKGAREHVRRVRERGRKQRPWFLTWSIYIFPNSFISEFPKFSFMGRNNEDKIRHTDCEGKA